MKNRLAVCTVTFQKKAPEEFLPVIAKLGFTNIDIWHRQLRADMTKAELEKIVDLAASFGLRIVSLCGSFGSKYMDASEEIRETGLEMDKRWIDLAADIGAKVARVFLGTIEREDKVFSVGVPYLRRLVEYAGQKGIVLGMENHRGYYSGIPEGAIKICQEIKSAYLGILYEPGNLLGEGYDFQEEFYHQAPYIVHLHLKDGYPAYYDDKYGKGYRLHSTLLGKGDLDIPWIFKHLKEINYQGYVSVEYESWHEEYNLPPIKEGLTACNAYLKKII